MYFAQHDPTSWLMSILVELARQLFGSFRGFTGTRGGGSGALKFCTMQTVAWSDFFFEIKEGVGCGTIGSCGVIGTTQCCCCWWWRTLGKNGLIGTVASDWSLQIPGCFRVPSILLVLEGVFLLLDVVLELEQLDSRETLTIVSIDFWRFCKVNKEV